MPSYRCLIMGAAGRDFHDFQTFFVTHPEFRVCGFTAAQIPFIDARSFPHELAGPGYEEDLPIYPEERLAELIRNLSIDFVFFAYSDLSHEEVMHRASLVQAAGAGFALLGPKQTQLTAARPVIAVTAVRTGAGKSPLTQWLARHLRSRSVRPGVIRHPMPYGNLRDQRVQHFETVADLDRFRCTIEEREEYEPYLEEGIPVFAGVRYAEILDVAGRQSDVILWDGGNNDTPFVRPDLWIVVADGLRPGHETTYYPGETNFRSADVIVISKASAASPESLQKIRTHANSLNPDAAIIEADLVLTCDDEEQLRGRHVLVIEDGPTLTHGGMASGAGMEVAGRSGVASIVDPRHHAVGTIAETLKAFPHLGPVLPACGYSDEQIRDLSETIRRSDAEIVIDGSPARLERLLEIPQRIVNVRYRFEQRSGPDLAGLVSDRLTTWAAEREGETDESDHSQHGV
ncbi:GTPase [Maioricimonas sp. JC845]|uniref:GTPase n=1 Tax=Maioricimonas sp. JC845 TaxID=3232138 RepID=UPI00345A89C8